ncbi:uncharacterized protein [Branchiostoma lanceolatum]|uniref:uncharacterized protein isoform X2 n=1 Tax=Branchiostoma lanceolatum TaxID=7740 RepID=UPI003454A831
MIAGILLDQLCNSSQTRDLGTYYKADKSTTQRSGADRTNSSHQVARFIRLKSIQIISSMKVALLIAVMLAASALVDSTSGRRRRGHLYKKGNDFEKKVAALELADDELEEDVNEVEEAAALGLVEDELEELEEELGEVNGRPDE